MARSDCVGLRIRDDIQSCDYGVFGLCALLTGTGDFGIIVECRRIILLRLWEGYDNQYPAFFGREVVMKNDVSCLVKLVLIVGVLVPGLCGFARAVSVVKCDLFEDYRIDFKDVEVVAENWLVDCSIDDCNGADLDGSDSVDLIDYSLFAEHWQTDPNFVRVWGIAQERLANSIDVLLTDPNYAGTDVNYPRSTDPNGKWKPKGLNASGYGHWASGFWPGAMWFMYKETSDEKWRDWAEAWGEQLEANKNRTWDHEAGFIIYRSFGFGYHLTGEPEYKQIVLEACDTLVSSRYYPVVGCLRSWGSYHCPVITDGMMMLEMLFWGAKNGGNPGWYDVAVSHSTKTMQNNVRADGSVWQIVDYDPDTGAVIGKYNKQGYDNDSTWSRGQAWGICGFTIAYRETGEPNYLATARKMADWFIDNLPDDYVPYWDFNAPGIPDEPKDSSAAAIAATGLLELSELDPDQQHKEKYYTAADNILESLSSPEYLAAEPNMGILLHGTGRGNPTNTDPNTWEIDTSLIYGDHFFIEALLRREGITIK